jgi:hypothetical protein
VDGHRLDTDVVGTATASVRDSFQSTRSNRRVVRVERFVDDDGWAIATAIR